MNEDLARERVSTSIDVEVLTAVLYVVITSADWHMHPGVSSDKTHASPRVSISV